MGQNENGGNRARALSGPATDHGTMRVLPPKPQPPVVNLVNKAPAPLYGEDDYYQKSESQISYGAIPQGLNSPYGGSSFSKNGSGFGG